MHSSRLKILMLGLLTLPLLVACGNVEGGFASIGKRGDGIAVGLEGSIDVPVHIRRLVTERCASVKPARAVLSQGRC